MIQRDSFWQTLGIHPTFKELEVAQQLGTLQLIKLELNAQASAQKSVGSVPSTARHTEAATNQEPEKRYEKDKGGYR